MSPKHQVLFGFPLTKLCPQSHPLLEATRTEFFVGFQVPTVASYVRYLKKQFLQEHYLCEAITDLGKTRQVSTEISPASTPRKFTRLQPHHSITRSM
ncbi:hypothetical protein PAHAL_1G106400 [Panicum hallii]|uniref:Uncharacterized protein n=1 Tax=Panicum hallii TaxID=206008 RepID=A0A2T8KUW2_9POAL|nr:hypothetical protein PAHAL_1G106400 [Panicum hallii]